MGHRRIPNKRVKQMLDDVLADEKESHSGAMVEGKDVKKKKQSPLGKSDSVK